MKRAGVLKLELEFLKLQLELHDLGPEPHEVEPEPHEVEPECHEVEGIGGPCLGDRKLGRRKMEEGIAEKHRP